MPDLFVSLRAGTKVNYRTPVARNTLAHTFQYGFVIPLEGIPETGLLLVVSDSDGEVAPHEEDLGSFRLSRDELLGRLRSGRVVIQLSEGPVEKFEIAISEYDGSLRKQSYRPDLALGLTEVPDVRVHAGEVLRVAAKGAYSIGRPDQIGPLGYAGERSQYNIAIEPMQSGNLGALFAVVGGNGALFPLLVTPCARVVAPFGGRVAVGVNDADYSNDAGDLRVEIWVRGPTVANWENGGWTGRCPGDAK